MGRVKEAWSEERIYESFPWLRTIIGKDRLPDGKGWDALFDARPDMVHLILADMVKQAYSKPGRVGQRPMPREEDVIDDLDWLLSQEPNRKPLQEVLPRLITGSERAFCDKINMSRRMFQRMMKNEYEPDLDQLRRIAKAVDRPPAFFIEYRRRMLLSALGTLLLQEPTSADWLYATFIKTVKEARDRGRTTSRHVGMKRVRDGVQAIYSIAEQFNIEVALRPKLEQDTSASRRKGRNPTGG